MSKTTGEEIPDGRAICIGFCGRPFWIPSRDDMPPLPYPSELTDNEILRYLPDHEISERARKASHAI